MKNQNYNGWTNYETWLTALWIDNDYGTYSYRCDLVKKIKEECLDEKNRQHKLAASLKDWIEEQNPLIENANLFSDLLNSALSEIDWNDIAESFLIE